MSRVRATLFSRPGLCTATRSSSWYARTSCGHPLIDIAPLLHGGDASVTVSHLRAALHQRGYFYAANVDVLPEAYIRSIYEYSQKAHALPAAVKARYRQRGGTGAYSGPDVGQLELQYEASGSPAAVCGWDYSRTRFTLAAEEAEEVQGAEEAQEAGGDPSRDTRYPSAQELEPLFASTLDEMYTRQDRLAVALLGGFEAALGLPPHTLRAMFDGGDFGTIRLLRYPGDAAAAEARS